MLPQIKKFNNSLNGAADTARVLTGPGWQTIASLITFQTIKGSQAVNFFAFDFHRRELLLSRTIPSIFAGAGTRAASDPETLTDSDNIEEPKLRSSQPSW
jgi:hypothetical protein